MLKPQNKRKCGNVGSVSECRWRFADNRGGQFGEPFSRLHTRRGTEKIALTNNTNETGFHLSLLPMQREREYTMYPPTVAACCTWQRRRTKRIRMDAFLLFLPVAHEAIREDKKLKMKFARLLHVCLY